MIGEGRKRQHATSDFDAAEGGNWRSYFETEYDDYRYKIILVSFLSTTMIPVALFLSDLIHGRHNIFFNYATSFLVMSAMTLYLIKSKRTDVMSPLTLLTAWAGFFCTVYLPGSRDIYIVILFNFVPLSFALFGVRSGRIWSIAFLLSVFLSWFLSETGIFIEWLPQLSWRMFVSGYISVGVMYLIISTMQKENETINRQLVSSLTCDKTTKLLNREIMLKRLRYSDNCIIAILRIENFRELSTLFGYDLSDKVLSFAAQRLSDLRTEHQFEVYKLFGSDFGLKICQGSSLDADMVRNILGNIIEEVQKHKLYWGDSEISLSYRAGGVLVSGGGTEESLSRAGAALAAGIRMKKSVAIYEEHNTEKDTALRSLTRFNTLNDNIRKSDFRAYIQPVVETGSREIRWYESLLRVRGAEGDYESVYPYLEIARSTGQYFHLTRFMLRNAEDLLLHTPCDVSVNIGLGDILDKDVFSGIAALSERTVHRPGRLILEILESEDLVEIDECKHFFSEVRALGCRIAIDDFGSGYANFANLLHIEADIVKIDGALVRRMEHDPDARVLISSISDFCARAGKKTVAEFVESRSIYEFVREQGIDYCQGYYFGGPFDSEGVTVRVDSESHDVACCVASRT